MTLRCCQQTETADCGSNRPTPAAKNVSAEVKLDYRKWLLQGHSDRYKRSWDNWVDTDHPAYADISRKQVDCDENDGVLGMCEDFAFMLLEHPVQYGRSEAILYMISADTRPQDTGYVGGRAEEAAGLYRSGSA